MKKTFILFFIFSLILTDGIIIYLNNRNCRRCFNKKITRSTRFKCI